MALDIEWMTGYSEVERGRSKRAIRRLLGNRILRVYESGNIVPGAFTPVLAKHSMSFSLIDCLSVGVIEVVALYDAARSSSVRMQMVVAIRVAYVKTSWVGPLRADEHSESLQSWAT